MKIRIVQAWERLQASYWFVPTIMTLAAVLLSEAAILAEDAVAADWLREAGWLYANQPEGARALLSTVAGSMITVAGVTFSMTILAISHASSQIGPRLLTDFMRDRGNQVTLGTFIATFIYCLLVLRTVRSADPVGAEGAVEAFVPHLAVLIALALALLGVGVLIYFVHHVPETLSMSNLIDRVGGTLLDRVECLYPTTIGAASEQGDEDARRLEQLAAEGTDRETIRAKSRLGYVQYVDEATLVCWATENDCVVELIRRPGDFVGPATELARIHRAGALDDDARANLMDCVVCGPERTPRQDVLFPALELVEVAVRALSPGVNDPFTANRCMDQLQAALIELAGRRPPEALRQDPEGALRVIARPVRFAEFAEVVFDALRPHVVNDPACCVHLLAVMAAVHDTITSKNDRQAIRGHAQALLDSAEHEIVDVRDRARMRAAAAPLLV